MVSTVEDKKAEVAAFCRRYGVERLDLFGSAVAGRFDSDSSDLDFIVSFERREPPDLFGRYFGLKEDLEALFGRSVDLVIEGALRKNPSLAAGVRESLTPYMRPERTRRTLEQIKDSVAFVLAAFEGKTLADYSGDRLLRQAVGRNLEIVGEAVGRLRQDDSDTASRLSEHERIIAFRNVLIHGYDLVDDELVWDTIETKLPVLLSEVEELLRERSS